MLKVRQMKAKLNVVGQLSLVLAILLLTNCATQGTPQTPKVERISEEELQRILPKTQAKLSLDAIVQLSKDGLSATQIIEKIKLSDSYYDLSPSQSLLLSKQGVPTEVLDYMHTSQEARLRNNVADEINKREKQKREVQEALKREQRNQQYYPPYWGYGGFGPYGFYRYGYGRFGWGAGFGRPFGWW